MTYHHKWKSAYYGYHAVFDIDQGGTLGIGIAADLQNGSKTCPVQTGCPNPSILWAATGCATNLHWFNQNICFQNLDESGVSKQIVVNTPVRLHACDYVCQQVEGTHLDRRVGSLEDI